MTATGLERPQAEAIASARRQAAADRDELATKADLYRALWIQAGAITAAVIALVRLLS